MQHTVYSCINRHTQHAKHAQINKLFNSSMIFLSIITNDYKITGHLIATYEMRKTKVTFEYLIVLVIMVIFSHWDRQDQRISVTYVYRHVKFEL